MHNRNKAWSRLLLKKATAKKRVIWFTISPSPSHTHPRSQLKLSWRLWSLQFPIHGNHYPWGKIMHFFPRVVSKERWIVCVHMRSNVCISVSTSDIVPKNWFNVTCQSAVALLLSLSLSKLSHPKTVSFLPIYHSKTQPTHFSAFIKSLLFLINDGDVALSLCLSRHLSFTLSMC